MQTAKPNGLRRCALAHPEVTLMTAEIVAAAAEREESHEERKSQK